MSQELIAGAIQKIKEALGEHAGYFEIKPDEVTLTDEDGVFSFLVKMTPESFDSDEGVVVCKPQLLQIDYVDGEYNIIVGEDHELEITFGNIYSVLFWYSQS